MLLKSEILSSRAKKFAKDAFSNTRIIRADSNAHSSRSSSSSSLFSSVYIFSLLQRDCIRSANANSSLAKLTKSLLILSCANCAFLASLESQRSRLPRSFPELYPTPLWNPFNLWSSVGLLSCSRCLTNISFNSTISLSRILLPLSIIGAWSVVLGDNEENC